MTLAPAPGPAAYTAARRRPEVLAPAGDFDSIRAAVENGADAVYFGVRKYSARSRAANFAIEELPELLSFLHLRGVKGYVAFNTLLFSEELEEAERMLLAIVAAGADALLLQDLGVARLAREISPDIPLHASTQTTTTSAEQMEVLAELGFSRVILARELSIQEIRKIRESTDMDLEVFVHGALCVAYSGQCLTSEALGGRSANRGACAQACRLPYDLVVDGERRDLGDRKYLISPRDLAAYDLVAELADLVVAFKIEGRLKSPEYVAATTRAYRKAVDERGARFEREEVLALQQVFSRGLSKGFLAGANHQELVNPLSPKKRGVFLGLAQDVRGSRIRVRLEGPMKPGDGVVFDYGRPEEDEPGGRVTHVWRGNARVDSADLPDEVEFEVHGDPRVEPGGRVWKTSDPALEGSLRATLEKTGRRVPVDATVEEAGGELRLTLSDGVHRVTAQAGPLVPARNRPLTPEFLRQHLGRLGKTPFELAGLASTLGNVILPVSRLNDLRRRAAADLERARRACPERRVRPGALARLRSAAPAVKSEGLEPRLVVLARTMEHLDAALSEGASWVECDFEDLRRYREAVERARAREVPIALAPPRIFKPRETGFLSVLLKAAPDAFLVRSTAHLAVFAREAPGVPRIGDYSLNVANDLTAVWALETGLARFVPSYDLDFGQLSDVLSRIDPARAEVVIHQHMPMFHMEHCVFAALLSSGRDWTDCGRPCDRHRVSLRDWVGKDHPVVADAGCRNTVYNAVPQSASQYVSRMLRAGVRWFRVELLREDMAGASRLVRDYREVLAGARDGETLWRELRASNVMGVTRGPLGRGESRG